MDEGSIEIEDPRDLALLRMAQGALMNDTVLPSGYRTPPHDMIVVGTGLTGKRPRTP